MYVKHEPIMISDLVTRPILIVGPLAEAVVDKLLSDFPHKFSRCEPKFTNLSQEVRLIIVLMALWNV